MQHWEYKKLDLCALPRRATETDLLNEAGSHGWELVTICVGNIALLKRPVPKLAASRRSSSTATAGT